MKTLPFALTVALVLSASASGFELFPQRKSSDPNELAGRKGGTSRARALQQEMMDFSDRYTMAIWQALDGYCRSEKDPIKRSAAEHLKVLFFLSLVGSLVPAICKRFRGGLSKLPAVSGGKAPEVVKLKI